MDYIEMDGGREDLLGLEEVATYRVVSRGKNKNMSRSDGYNLETLLFDDFFFRGECGNHV